MQRFAYRLNYGDRMLNFDSKYLILFVFFYLALPNAICDAKVHDSQAESLAYYAIQLENPYIDVEEKKRIQPYLISVTHPIFPTLESIFTQQRATLNLSALTKAGFIIKFIQQRSFIIVASHPLMPGYLFKIYLDSELRIKRATPGWQWFVNRVRNANKIRHFIKKNKIRYFVAPHKWIYALPASPLPPFNDDYVPKWEILVVKDMQLVSKEENLTAWKTKITKKHLDELYTIIKYAGGSSYRASNIPMTQNGTFAFVDTEYTTTSPDTESILPYLSSKMARYWKKKTKRQ